MSHYEERLQKDLTQILSEVKVMGGMAEKILNNAVHALLTNNQQLANQTVLDDQPVNRMMRKIDKLCHAFIARHLPSAGHLRLISSIIRMNIELERIGDYAVTISREAIQLDRVLPGLLANQVETVAKDSQHTLHRALTSFYDENADLAKATIDTMTDLEASMDGIYASVISGEHISGNKELFALFTVLGQLKRVADQAKNMCEETVFAVTGETKAKKVYKILFVDQDNSGLSQLAEVIATKNYPNSGKYYSAGKQPAANINAEMVSFMEQHGLDFEGMQPKELDFSPQELAAIHVIVSLQGKVQDYIPSVPFHTASLNWDIGQLPATDNEAAESRYSEIYRELSVYIRELMELMRGEGAD